MKLSENMKKALKALPLHYTKWGSSIVSNDFPEGVTMRTIDALFDRKLITIKHVGHFERKIVKLERQK